MLDLDVDCGCDACVGDPTITASSMGKPPVGRGRRHRRPRK